MLGEKSSVVAGLRNKLVVLADRFMPRTMQRTIMRKVMSG
jgi:hypothetical protein